MIQNWELIGLLNCFKHVGGVIVVFRNVTSAEHAREKYIGFVFVDLFRT